MVRGGRAEAPGPRSDVSFRLDQKTGNFKAAFPSRPNQWGALTEGKQKNELAQKEFRFIKTIIIIKGGNYLPCFASTSALHCSKRRQTSRWPPRADECSGVHRLNKSKRINLRKQSFTSGDFTRNNNNNKGGVITCSPSPPHQRCTAAKDGKLQGGL